MYERFIDALEDGRQATREEVTAADLLRDQQIRERSLTLRQNHRRESHRVRVMLVRRGEDPMEELLRLRDDHEAAMALVEVQTPPVQEAAQQLQELGIATTGNNRYIALPTIEPSTVDIWPRLNRFLHGVQPFFIP
ncbi:hypothetical protein P3T76_007655 [Phytophthora citrophthora]|uniref:Uncharacterized protein n=1 Tax=Phytophthora citrophthora TaxID=4793 RepID=A0AAD9GLH8_9STRA|nr:hypothetical protein P3T76_007655 [Phytophthora citrophthora]